MNPDSPIAAPTLHVVYSWWPEDGCDWICPEDVALVRRLIPSDRVIRRDRVEGPYNVMRYGPHVFRVKPTLWRVVAFDGFDVGDWVEVRSLFGKNRPGLGQIHEMRWRPREGRIHYFVRQREMRVARHYTALDLRPTSYVPLPAEETESAEVLGPMDWA